MVDIRAIRKGPNDTISGLDYLERLAHELVRLGWRKVE